MIPRFLESRDEALMRSANWFTSTFRVHLCLRRLAGGNLHSGRIRIVAARSDQGVLRPGGVPQFCNLAYERKRLVKPL